MPITPAPSLVELYNFQERFVSVAYSALAAAGLPIIPRTSDDPAPLIACWASFTVGSPTQNLRYDSQDRGHYSDYRGCQLVVKIRRPRDDNGTDNGEPPSPEVLTSMASMAAEIRVLFAQFQHPFTPEALGFYGVSRIAPSGEGDGFEPDYLCDTLEMRWAVNFEILPEAFPV